MKIRNLIYTLLIIAPGILIGQQVPLYNHNFMNPYIVNPAYVGKDTITDVFLLYRNQWAGITGAPETQLITIEGSLLGNKLGIGGKFYNDISNIYGRTGGYMSYSYKVPLDSIHQLRFGMSIGVVQNRIHFDRIQAQSPTESTILEQGQSQTKLDGSFGLVYSYNDKIEVGFSSLQLFSSQYNYVNQATQKESNFKLLRHYYVTTSYKYQTNHIDWLIKPFAMLRSTQSLPFQWDVGIQTFWKQKYWLTALYRHNNGVTAALGGNLNKRIQVGYSYDIALGGLNKHTGGTHEIVMNISLIKSKSNGSNNINFEHDEQMVERVTRLKNEVDSIAEKVTQLKQEAIAQKQSLDSLYEKKKILQVQVDKNTEQIGLKNEELRQLKEHLSKDRDELHDFFEHEKVGFSDKDTLDNRFWEYFVVVDTYTELNYAKFLQKKLLREYGTKTTLTQSGTSSDPYYLVWTKKITSKEAALKEMARLKNLIDSDYITEGAWLYHKRK